MAVCPSPTMTPTKPARWFRASCPTWKACATLIGTGIVEFVGGLLGALGAMFFLLRISTPITIAALTLMLFLALPCDGHSAQSDLFSGSVARLMPEGSGRLTESLGGVRVIKGYHAEAREAAVFGAGVQRLLDNVMKSLTAMSLMSLSATVLMGIVGALVMYMGTNEIYAGKLTQGGLVSFTALLAMMTAPVVGIVNIGTQITDALAGLERTREVLRERPEDEDPSEPARSEQCNGLVEFENVKFAYNPERDVLHGISFIANPRHGYRVCGAVWFRQIDHYRADFSVFINLQAAEFWSTEST